MSRLFLALALGSLFGSSAYASHERRPRSRRRVADRMLSADRKAKRKRNKNQRLARARRRRCAP